MKLHILLCLILIGSIVSAAQLDCEFAIIIPSYNNEHYVEENLLSVCFQETSNPYHIYYVNDCSTDRTQECVEGFIHEHNLEDRVTLINNPVNMGMGANIYNVIHNFIDDHKIVVILDGDDLFPHKEVLLTLENYYKDPDLWITYGRLKRIPSGMTHGQDIPDSVFAEKRVRETYPTSLRTFKAALYKKIKKEDLMRDGEFIKVTGDMAFFLPMLEMAAPQKECLP